MRGEVNFPTVVCEPFHVVNFGNLPPNVTEEKLIVLRNISPLVTKFKFEWLTEFYEEIGLSVM